MATQRRITRVSLAQGIEDTRDQSLALAFLAERGLSAEAEAKEQVETTYKRFLTGADQALKDVAGKHLIRAIFGAEAMAEDPVR